MSRKQIMCDACGKRPAKMFRRSHKMRGRKSNLIIKSSPDHPLCNQCHNNEFESIRQARYANENSSRTDFEEVETQ